MATQQRVTVVPCSTTTFGGGLLVNCGTSKQKEDHQVNKQNRRPRIISDICSLRTFLKIENFFADYQFERKATEKVNVSGAKRITLDIITSSFLFHFPLIDDKIT